MEGPFKKEKDMILLTELVIQMGGETRPPLRARLCTDTCMHVQS